MGGLRRGGLAWLLLLVGCRGPDFSAATFTRAYLQERYQPGERVWAPWPDIARLYLGEVVGSTGRAYEVLFPNGDRGLYHAEELRAVRLFRGELVLAWHAGEYWTARVLRTGPEVEVELETGATLVPVLVGLPRGSTGWPPVAP